MSAVARVTSPVRFASTPFKGTFSDPFVYFGWWRGGGDFGSRFLSGLSSEGGFLLGFSLAIGDGAGAENSGLDFCRHHLGR
jgi:hypothetical protein